MSGIPSRLRRCLARAVPIPVVLAAACCAAGAAMLGTPLAGHPSAAAAYSQPDASVPGAPLGPSVALRRERDLRYAGPGGPALDVFQPRRGAGVGAPAVLTVHGGAWAHGDRARMAQVAAALAHAGFVVFNADYSLAAPGRPGFPRQLRELRAAVRWIRRNATRFGVDPARIGALGSSAGGHLVGLLATAGRGGLNRGSRVGAAVTWSAPFDLPRLGRHRLRWAVGTFLGCRCPGRALAASPVAHAGRGDPPMLIFNSRRELVPAFQAHAMAARLASAGVPHRLRLLDGSLHARLYAAVALEPTIAFLRRRLG